MRCVGPSSKWLIAVVVLMATAIGWGALVYVADWPIAGEHSSGCVVCRASRTVSSCFLIPVRVQVRESEFSRW